MYKVGVTGGIGSGKSTVCALLAAHGAAVYDCDARAKELMNTSAQLREAISREFGAECYDSEGRLDRVSLARRVFADAAALERLNAIVHPAVRDDFRCWAEMQTGAYAVMESAILFDAGFESEVDTTLAVLAPEQERVRRAAARDGASSEEILRRMAHQLSDEELHARADRTIVNLRRDYLDSDVECLHKIYSYEAQR